jgi:hypothetical protein
MDQIRPIVTFLSLIGLFFAAVFPIAAHLLFGVPLASSAGEVLFAVAFAAYWLGCFLSCLSFLRGASLVGVAVGVHLLMAVLLVIDLTTSHAPVLLLAVPVWLLFVVLFALMVIQRLRKETA